MVEADTLPENSRKTPIPEGTMVVVPRVHPAGLNVWEQVPFTWARVLLSVEEEEKGGIDSDDDWYKFLGLLARRKLGRRIEGNIGFLRRRLVHAESVVNFLDQYEGWPEYFDYAVRNSACNQKTGKPVRKPVKKGPQQVLISSFAAWWLSRQESEEGTKWIGLEGEMRERGMRTEVSTRRKENEVVFPNLSLLSSDN